MTNHARPNSGDLIVYNVGRAPHSMGLVLETAKQFSNSSTAKEHCVLVQWVTMDGPTPRQRRIRVDHLAIRDRKDVLTDARFDTDVGDRAWYWSETSGGYLTFKVVQSA